MSFVQHGWVFRRDEKRLGSGKHAGQDEKLRNMTQVRIVKPVS